VAFGNLIQDVLGSIPGMNRGLAATRINEAFMRIQMDNVWSFQCITSGFLTPGLLGGPVSGQGQSQSFNAGATFLSPGTITVTPFTTTITGDAVATAAWIATIANPPFITQYQIRVPYYSIYSITALNFAGTVAYLTVNTPGSAQTPGTYVVAGISNPIIPTGSGALAQITVNGDGTVTLPPVILNAGTGYLTPQGDPNPPTFTLAAGGVPATFTAQLNAVLTIDRLWTEPAQLNSSYMCYQAYFPLPPGFRRFYGARDTSNNNEMDTWSYTQLDLANIDAERTVFDEPLYLVPYQIDNRPGSATLGQWLVECWPHPLSSLPYTYMCQANWPPLSSPQDNLPYPLTEEIVRQRAYEMCCLWKAGQVGDDMERGSGANWPFLAKAYHEEYKDLLRQIRLVDRNLTDLYFHRAQTTPSAGYQDGFMTQTSQLNIGAF
jgi:hypothetical protein